MRRILAVLGGLSLVAGAAASAAASGPVRAKPFSGTGTDYLNKGKTWKPGATGKFTFKTSGDGRKFLDFRGSYTYACGGTATLTAGFVTITSAGKFDYAFKVKQKAGTFYAQIYGQFQRQGKTAVVDYLVDYVAKGKRVAHPYDTSHPASLGCASWVRGTAKAG